MTKTTKQALPYLLLFGTLALAQLSSIDWQQLRESSALVQRHSKQLQLSWWHEQDSANAYNYMVATTPQQQTQSID